MSHTNTTITIFNSFRPAGRKRLNFKSTNHKNKVMKSFPKLIAAILIFSSCSRFVTPGRPQSFYRISDSSFIIKGNAKHFQERADRKARHKELSKN